MYCREGALYIYYHFYPSLFAFLSVGAWERGYVLAEIACASRILRPNAAICGLGTRQRVRMRT